MINGGLSGQMWGEEVPPVFFRPDDDCGNLLASFPLKGADALGIDGLQVDLDIEIYERCVKIRFSEPNGTVLEDKKVPNNGFLPPGGQWGDPLEIPVPAAGPGGIPVTLLTRIYDDEARDLPLRKDPQGVATAKLNGYIKFIEVTGCDCRFIQLIRLTIYGWDPQGNPLDGYGTTFPPDGGFGIDSPGKAPGAGDKNNPWYPFAGSVPNVAGMCYLLDTPSVPESIRAGLGGFPVWSWFKLVFEFKTWVFCNNQAVAYWEWGYEIEFQLQPGGSAGNFRISPVPRLGGRARLHTPTSPAFAASKAELERSLK